MSRHVLKTLATDVQSLEVVVGWDAPLNTYFAQVIRFSTSVDEEDEVLLHCGFYSAEVPSPEAALKLVAPWVPEAEHNHDLLVHLDDDRLYRRMQHSTVWSL